MILEMKIKSPTQYFKMSIATIAQQTHRMVLVCTLCAPHTLPFGGALLQDRKIKGFEKNKIPYTKFVVNLDPQINSALVAIGSDNCTFCTIIY